MEAITLNKWEKYKYHDPAIILKKYRNLEYKVAVSDLDDKVKNLRKNNQKEYREGRDAALFCYGLSKKVIGENMYFANCEDADYDFITCFKRDDTLHYTPVQLKEVVPEMLNRKSNLNETISKLGKYTSSQNLVVAIHVNKSMELEFDKIVVPKLPIAELWLFGALNKTQDEWFIYGDILNNPTCHKFNYPI